MKSRLLLPNRFKTIGIILFVPFLILGILNRYWGFVIDALTPHGKQANIFSGANNFTDEVALTGLIVSLLLIAFARERQEDEFIYQNRLESWEWAVLINFLLLLVACWAFYDTAFLDVMIYNMLTPLVIFIIRFHWVLLRNKKSPEKN